MAPAVALLRITEQEPRSLGLEVQQPVNWAHAAGANRRPGLSKARLTAELPASPLVSYGHAARLISNKECLILLSDEFISVSITKLRHYATSRKVTGSIPDEVIGFFQLT
jgi:hypothetical protein